MECGFVSSEAPSIIREVLGWEVDRIFWEMLKKILRQEIGSLPFSLPVTSFPS